jgi:hypothetical protein
MLRPQTLRTPAQAGLGHAGLDVDLEENEVTPSQGAVVEAEIRPAHAPAAERNMRRQR